MSNERRASELDTSAPEGSVLHVRVGSQVLADGLRDVARTMESAQAGRRVEPRFSVGFPEAGQMLAVFTPKRWELITALRRSGPSTVRALAQRLGRDYKNVHGDVAALEQWLAVQRMPDGRVHVPWSEIVMDMKLPAAGEALAA